MSDLTFIEQNHLELLFGMGNGYVLNFSDRTFRMMVADSVGIDIELPKYGQASKAKRLREFWRLEPNHVVGKLTKDLIAYAEAFDPSGLDPAALVKSKAVADRLSQGASVSELDALRPNAAGRSFEACAKAVRESIQNNEPEVGLDRLHTFMAKYIRQLCEKHSIPFDKEKSMTIGFNLYIRLMQERGKLESDMAFQILRSSISILDRFNAVRNDRTLAHDNELLGYHEALLIFNHVAASVRYLEFIESECEQSPNPAPLPAVPGGVDLFALFQTGN